MKKTIYLFLLALLALAFTNSSNAYADEIKDKAIADFENVTIPHIIKMAPYISQDAQARAVAFPNYKAISDDCWKTASSAYDAKEGIAKSAAYICKSLALWMSNQDAITCQYIKWSDDSDALKKPNDKKIIKIYEKSNAKKTLQDLEKAAGCNNKDKKYWALRVLNSYKNISGFISSDAKLRVNVPIETLELAKDDCYYSSVLSDNYSDVEEAVYSGCYAIFKYGKGGDNDPCTSWFNARNTAKKIKENDPLYDELLALRVSFLDLTGKTGCEANVQKLFAEQGEIDEKDAKDAKIQEQVNGLLNSYAIARRSADSNMVLVNAWEGRSYDNKYLTKDENKTREEARKEVIAIVCRYYQYTRNDVVNAQSAASQIYKLQPNDANKARFQSEINNMKFLNTEVNNWCN